MWIQYVKVACLMTIVLEKDTAFCNWLGNVTFILNEHYKVYIFDQNGFGAITYPKSNQYHMHIDLIP